MVKSIPLLALAFQVSLPALSQAPSTPPTNPPMVFSLDASDRRAEYPTPLRGVEAKRWESWSNMRMGATAMLGWKIGIRSDAFGKTYLTEALTQIDNLALGTVEVASDQKFDSSIPKNIDTHLYPDEIRTVLNKFIAINIEPVAYHVPSLGDDEESIRSVLRLAQSLKVTTIVTDKIPTNLSLVQRLAAEAKLQVAICGAPSELLSAIGNDKPNVGVCADTGAWLESGLNAVDTVTQLKGQLFILNVRDRSATGKAGHDVIPGTGVLKLDSLLMTMYRSGIKPSLMTVSAPAGAMQKSVEAFDEELRPMIVDVVKETSRTQAIKRNTTAEEHDAVFAALSALPKDASVKPKKPRKLLVIDLNTPHGGHRSIPAGNLAIEEMGKRTGAWETVFSNDLDNLKYPAIKQYDAVFLHNTVGLILADLEVRKGLLRFVQEGGGLGGNHGTSHAAMDWPEFSEMLGARRGVHRQATEKDWVKITDPNNLMTAPFQGKEFLQEDEFYRFPNPPYSRTKVHELLSLDVEKSDMNQAVVFVPGVNIVRPDEDYAVAWIKTYGKGRVFYTTLGHNANLFFSTQMDQFFMNGIQYILGDLDADATPSATLR
jgi:type 1 glutamine amidotransferase/sugar phosphate isomerase/epimerase